MNPPWPTKKATAAPAVGLPGSTWGDTDAGRMATDLTQKAVGAVPGAPPPKPASPLASAVGGMPPQPGDGSIAQPLPPAQPAAPTPSAQSTTQWPSQASGTPQMSATPAAQTPAPQVAPAQQSVYRQAEDEAHGEQTMIQANRPGPEWQLGGSRAGVPVWFRTAPRDAQLAQAGIRPPQPAAQPVPQPASQPLPRMQSVVDPTGAALAAQSQPAASPVTRQPAGPHTFARNYDPQAGRGDGYRSPSLRQDWDREAADVRTRAATAEKTVSMADLQALQRAGIPVSQANLMGFDERTGRQIDQEWIRQRMPQQKRRMIDPGGRAQIGQFQPQPMGHSSAGFARHRR